VEDLAKKGERARAAADKEGGVKVRDICGGLCSLESTTIGTGASASTISIVLEGPAPKSDDEVMLP
jgi:hypothetical protein